VKHQSLPWNNSTAFVVANSVNSGDNAYTAYCKLGLWAGPYDADGGTKVNVACYTGWGERVDSRFNEVYEHSQYRTPC
jgi:hypothetical protein